MDTYIRDCRSLCIGEIVYKIQYCIFVVCVHLRYTSKNSNDDNNGV